MLSHRPDSPYGDLEDLVEFALQQRRLEQTQRPYEGGLYRGTMAEQPPRSPDQGEGGLAAASPTHPGTAVGSDLLERSFLKLLHHLPPPLPLLLLHGDTVY